MSELAEIDNKLFKLTYSVEQMDHVIERILSSLEKKDDRLNEIENRQSRHSERMISLQDLLQSQDRRLDEMKEDIKILIDKNKEREKFKNGLLFFINNDFGRKIVYIILVFIIIPIVPNLASVYHGYTIKRMQNDIKDIHSALKDTGIMNNEKT